MNKIQKEVDNWAQQFTIPYWKPHEVMVRLMEEMGELAREVNHRYGPKKKKSTEDLKDIEDEIGDILFTLSCLANPLNIDLDKCGMLSVKKSNTRDKDRYEKKGRSK